VAFADKYLMIMCILMGFKIAKEILWKNELQLSKLHRVGNFGIKIFGWLCPPLSGVLLQNHAKHFLQQARDLGEPLLVEAGENLSHENWQKGARGKREVNLTHVSHFCFLFYIFFLQFCETTQVWSKLRLLAIKAHIG
jgi:hypothetical protein